MRCPPPTSAVTWCVAFPIDSLDGARGGAGQCALCRLAGVTRGRGVWGEQDVPLHPNTRRNLLAPVPNLLPPHPRDPLLNRGVKFTGCYRVALTHMLAGRAA